MTDIIRNIKSKSDNSGIVFDVWEDRVG